MDDKCELYGCLRDAVKPEVLVEFSIDEEVVEIAVCEYHKDYINNMDSTLYEVGFNFRHQVELRLRPVPLPVVPPEEPEE